MTIEQLIIQTNKKLKYINGYSFNEPEIILCHLLKYDRITLHLNFNKQINHNILQQFENIIQKRLKNYPLEYILEKVSFYGYEFKIVDGVLIPRPETEILVDKVFQIIKNLKKPQIIEIGTGSGIIAILLAIKLKELNKEFKIIAVDINNKALSLAQENSKLFGVEHNIKFINSDLLTNVEHNQIQKTDIIVSNPPYIANDFKLDSNVIYEPSNALFGGNIGDEILKQIIDITFKYKIKYLACEIGYDQKEKILQYLQQKKYMYKSIQFYNDWSNINRGFILLI